MNENTCLADAWTSLIFQYKTAGDLLFESTNNETIRMPATFLYRQSVELFLKRDILICSEVLQLPFEEFSKNYQKKHSLETLWKGCLLISGQIKGIDESDGFASDKILRAEDIQGAIAQFQALDADSASLRYPLRSDGSPIAVELTNDKIAELRTSFEAIAIFFSDRYAVLKAIFDKMKLE